MIRTTNRSKAVAFLLYVRRSTWRNIGIIGNMYYSYNRSGAYSFELRRDWRSDFSFPGIPTTKKKISTIKDLLPLLTAAFFKNAECDGLTTQQ